jgi:hypothetical protein
MANTLTVTTAYTAGITTNSEGFTPVVTKHFDASKVGIAANAVVVALKVPQGSVLRAVVLDVKTAGVGAVKLGNHVGALNAGDTDSDLYSGSGTDIALTSTGKTLKTVAIASRAITAADTYIVCEFTAAESAAVIDVTAIVDVFDLASVAL